MFNLCVLCYGDYPRLASRCLESLREAPAGYVTDLRIGLNAVSPVTMSIVTQFAWSMRFRYRTSLYIPSENVGKGALMRRMFYDPGSPLGNWVMWFDDDSYLDPSCKPAWWEGVAAETRTPGLAVLGRIHTIRIRGNQADGIQTQPWFTGKPVLPMTHRYQFVTGGWWVADAQFLSQWNFPFPEIWHNGDDSILGELVRQQGRVNKNSDFARCCCESCLKRPVVSSTEQKVLVNAEGNAGRRGIALRGEVWPWQNYVPGQEPDLSHHNFTLTIQRF